MLHITLHEFQYTNLNCPISSVSEKFHVFLNMYSQRTEHLVDFILTVALETSCKASVRILRAIQIKISGDTSNSSFSKTVFGTRYSRLWC